jgi:hypothetical protein
VLRAKLFIRESKVRWAISFQLGYSSNVVHNGSERVRAAEAVRGATGGYDPRQ